MNQYSVTEKPISHLKFRMNVLVLGLAVIADCLLPTGRHIVSVFACFCCTDSSVSWKEQFSSSEILILIELYLSTFFFGALNFCFQGQELTLTLNSLHNFLSARLLILLVTLLQMSFPGFCSWKRWVETLSEEGGGVTLTDVFIQIEQKSYFLWKLPSCLSVVLEPEQL